MTTAIVIFSFTALYAFADYYKTNDLKDLGFAIIMCIGAVATFIQTLDNNKQSDNIERLAQLDTSISHHIDTLATIDTNISSNTNGVVGNIFNLSRQNIALSDSIKKLDSAVYSLTNDISKISQSTNTLTQKLDIKTDEEFAVTGKFNLLLNKSSNTVTISFGAITLTNPKSYFNLPIRLSSIINTGITDQIYLQIYNDSLLITTSLHDIYSHSLCQIENNDWRVNKNVVSKFNYDNKGLELFDNYGRIAFSINISADNIIQIQGIFRNGKDGQMFFVPGYFANFLIDSNDYEIFLLQHPFKQLFKYTGTRWHGMRN